MKMKRVGALIAGIFFAATALSEGTDVSIPSLDQLKYIRLSLHNISWDAKFHPDGSAMLEYNMTATFPPTANAPEGSFSFEDVYNLLLPHLKQNLESREDMYVSLELVNGIYGPRWEDVGYVRFYLEDRETIRKLMYALADKAVPRDDVFVKKEPFENALRTAPLVPGDPPALNEDGTPSYDREKYANTALWNAEQAKPMPEPPAVTSVSAQPGKPPAEPELTPEPPPSVIADEAEQPTPEPESGRAKASPPSRPPSRLLLCIIPLLIVAVTGILYFRHKK